MLQASQAIPEVPDDATCTVYTTNDFQVQLWATSTSIWESGASWSNLLDRINLEQSRLWSDSFAAKLHFGHLWTICKHCKLLIRSTQTIVESISSNSMSFIWFSKKVYLVRKKNMESLCCEALHWKPHLLRLRTWMNMVPCRLYKQLRLWKKPTGTLFCPS